MTLQQEQYIAEWQEHFEKYIGDLICFIEAVIVLPNVTDEVKNVFEQIKLMLKGKDVIEIKHDLAKRVIRQDTLNKLERFDKELIDMCVGHLTAESCVKEF